jgi:hypothetical protein
MSALMLALLVGVVAFRSISGGRYRPVVDGALRWGLLVGGVGFALGFVGPIIVVPQANQGPLLGIFVTGPLGFLAGVAWGAFRALVHRAPDGRRT